MSVRASINSLAWESDFFAIKTAKLELSSDTQQINVADFASYDLIQAKIASHDLESIDALYGLGFKFAEGEADFVIPITIINRELITTGTENALSTQALDYAQAADIPLLKQAAASVFAKSRFRAPWYQPDDSGRFYATWIEKAVTGTFDDVCLLVKDTQHNIAGFVSLRRLNNKEARIGLLAVLEGQQGKGIGNKLMSAAQQWCENHNFDTLRVATQLSNLAAMRLYTKSGGSICSTAYWLYRGCNDPI